MGAEVVSDDRRYTDAVLLTGDGSLLGEPDWAIRQAEKRGIIYNCTAEDGSCGYGVHTSDPGPSTFWHLSPGFTDDDYDDATQECDG